MLEVFRRASSELSDINEDINQTYNKYFSYDMYKHCHQPLIN